MADSFFIGFGDELVKLAQRSAWESASPEQRKLFMDIEREVEGKRTQRAASREQLLGAAQKMRQFGRTPYGTPKEKAGLGKIRDYWSSKFTRAAQKAPSDPSRRVGMYRQLSPGLSRRRARQFVQQEARPKRRQWGSIRPGGPREIGWDPPSAVKKPKPKPIGGIRSGGVISQRQAYDVLGDISTKKPPGLMTPKWAKPKLTPEMFKKKEKPMTFKGIMKDAPLMTPEYAKPKVKRPSTKLTPGMFRE